MGNPSAMIEWSWGFNILTLRLPGLPSITLIILPIVLTTYYFIHKGTSRKKYKVIAILYSSMVLHEIGHAVVAEWLGIGISNVGFGGFFAYVMPIDLSNHWAVILMCLAGPAVNYVIYKLTTGDTSELNKSLFEGNIVPVPPFDGYRAIQNLCLAIGLSTLTAFTIYPLYLTLKLVMQMEIVQAWIKDLTTRA